MGIVEELVEIWLNKVCDTYFLWLYVNGEEDMSTVVKSTPPSTDKTSKDYKSWKEDWEQYKTWLQMDSAAIGLLNSSIDST